MTYTEILEVLKANVDIYELSYGTDGELEESIEGIGKWDVVDEEGGHEGDGEHFHIVYFFPDHDVYIRFNGSYTSYGEGREISWKYAKEVRPQEKTITVYESL